MHGDSAPEDGRRDTTSTRWPYDSPFAWAMPPPRRRRERGRRGRLRDEEDLARLRRTWADSYEFPDPPRRRWRRPGLAARNRQTGAALAARSAGALERAVLEDYAAMLARSAHARVAGEQAAAGARTQAVPVFHLPPAPRPYVRDGEPS